MYQKANLDRHETNDWVWVLKFDKFYFPNISDSWTSYEKIIEENKDKKILFIGKPGDFPKNVNILKEVKFLNGDTAFQITNVK